MSFIEIHGGIKNLSDSPDIAFQYQEDGTAWPSVVAAHNGVPADYLAEGKIRFIDTGNGKGKIEYWYHGGKGLLDLKPRYENLESAQSYIDTLTLLLSQAQSVYDNVLQIGTSAFKYQGPWYPALDIPDLAALDLDNTPADIGKYYRAAEGGSSSITGELIVYAAEDGVVWNGSEFVFVKAPDLTIFLDNIGQLYLLIKEVRDRFRIDGTVQEVAANGIYAGADGTYSGWSFGHVSIAGEMLYKVDLTVDYLIHNTSLLLNIFKRPISDLAITLGPGKGAHDKLVSSLIYPVTGFSNTDAQQVISLSFDPLPAAPGFIYIFEVSARNGSALGRLGMGRRNTEPLPGDQQGRGWFQTVINAYQNVVEGQAIARKLYSDEINIPNFALTGGSSKTLQDLDNQKASLAQGVTYGGTVEGSNHLNEATNTIDKFINNAGQLQTAGGSPGTFTTSDFIKWKALQTQFVAGENNVIKKIFAVAQYDDSGNLIAGSYPTPVDNILTPITKVAGAAKFRITYRLAAGHITKVNQVNFGNSTLPFEAYYSKRLATGDGTGAAAVYPPNTEDADLVAKFTQSGGSTKTLNQVEAEKISVGKGLTYLSTTVYPTNKYDFATASQTLGFLASNTGTINAASAGTYHPTPLIEWGDQTILSVGLNSAAAGTGAYSALQYDAAGVPIAASWTGTAANIKTLTKFDGAVFFRITMREGLQNQLNFGNTVLPYAAYFTPYLKKKAAKDDLGNDASFATDPDDENLNAKFANRQALNNILLQNARVWAATTVITVKASGGDFADLNDALNSITDASPSKRYTVKLYDDIVATQKAHYKAVPGTTSFSLGTVPAYVEVLAMNGPRFLQPTLPTDLPAADYPLYEGLRVDGNARVTGINIICENIRYGIHIERSNDLKNQNTLVELIDCTVIHKGCLNVPEINRWAAPDAIGCGVTGGMKFYFRGVRALGFRHGLRVHTNTADSFGTYFDTQNCDFGSMQPDGHAINADNSPTSRESRVWDLTGTSLAGAFYAKTEISADCPVLDKIAPSIKVIGGGGQAMYFKNDQQAGSVLRITTNATAAAVDGSNPAVISSISVVSDQAGLLGNINSRPGTYGQKAAIWGNRELLESGTADRRNLIGHRLGNRTTTPWTLVLNVNGDVKTVTFNQNYSDGNFATAPLISAATILAAINSTLSGFATADFFKIGLEYYPEQPDRLFYKSNVSTTAFIPKGSPVRFIGFAQCRIAADDEIPDGLAIDDLPVSGHLSVLPGRVIKNAVLPKPGGSFSRFSPLLAAGSETFDVGHYFTVAAGKYVKTTIPNSFARAIDTNNICIG